MLQELVNQNQQRLTETDLFIWSIIIDDKKANLDISIDELAKKCLVSRTTIMRFCQKLGFKGYSEFKYHLKEEYRNEQALPASYEKEILENYSHTIEIIEQKDFTSITKMMSTAKRIFIYGSGDIQNLVSGYMKLLFLHSELLVYDFGGLSINEHFYQVLEPTDLVFLITLNGESETIVKLAKQLKQRKIPTIGITKLKNSPVAKLCSETIFVFNSEIRTFSSKSTYFESTSILFFVIEYLLIKYDDWIIKESRKNEQ